MNEMKMHSGGVCMSCGGLVDDDGLAQTSEEGWDGEQTGESEGGPSEQSMDTDMMRYDGFASAIGRRASSPLPRETPPPPEHEPMANKPDADALEEAKRQRYGNFRKGK